MTGTTAQIASNELAVVVPVKSFGAAKQRLDPHLDGTQRADLARFLADRVVDVIVSGGATAWVACDDDEVERWARAAGAQIAWTPGLGLNGAIAEGVGCAIDAGAQHIIVSHADLARPSRLLSVATPATIALVPDRHLDGTNVMAFPAYATVEPSYGAGSFRRHLDAAGAVAEAAGCRIGVLRSPDLGLDVDTMSDVRHPSIREELPRWLRTHPDNRSTPTG